MHKKIFLIGLIAASLLPLGTTFAKDRNLPGIKIIKRADR